MGTIERKLRLSDLKPGMVISRDIVNRLTGELIIKKDTVISEQELQNLRNYQIIEKSISDSQANTGANLTAKYWEEASKRLEEEDIRKGSIPGLKEKDREPFITFVRSYEKVEEKTKEFLDSIDNGEPIDPSGIFTMTDDIINGLNTRSDVFTYLSYLKDRSDYTYTHSINLSLLCNIFGKWLNYPEEDLKDLTVAGMMHDIGKLSIDPAIINKRGKLTEEEFDKMKLHPIYGYDVLRDQPISNEIKLAALQHHERMDGSGYPSHLKEEEINRFAKIVGICDVYEAMISERPYREKLCPFGVIREFERLHYGKLDTKFLLVFLKNIAYNYLGRRVELSDGQKGEVIFINEGSLSTPIVQMDNGTCMDLMYNRNYLIEKVL